MPKIDVSYSDLCELIGRRISFEELKQYIFFAKAEIEGKEGDVLKIDSKDTNRPDLWSVEGIARELRGRLGEKGLPKYKIERSGLVVNVDQKVAKVRPLTVCAVAKNLNIDDIVLSQLIQLQEKVAGTFGRGRKEVAIGVYDLSKIKPPIKYTTATLEKHFVPLDFEEEMTIKEILEKHPKGKEFGHLLKGCKEVPMFIDSAGEVLSIPPIINSNFTGRITKETKQVFIECSGFDFKFLMPAINVLAAALVDRNAKVESVDVVYGKKIIRTPDMTPKSAFVDLDFVNRLSGLNLNAKQTTNLLEQARYQAAVKGKRINVLYPAYRQDIMHQSDVAEDVIISFGYNKIPLEQIKHQTIGKVDRKEILTERLENEMVKLGFQEILSYTLTSKEQLFKKMGLREGEVVEIENPISLNWNVFRSWLLPSVMEFFSNNQHVTYPQKIFEIGDAILIDEKQETGALDVRKLSVAVSDSRIGYEGIAPILDAFLANMKVKYKLKRGRHASFIEGRVADVVVGGKKIGFIGEIHPAVLKNWHLEMPVAAFEIDLDAIQK
jgi:phenylalanyl-tRNA synthetase beta chain